MKEISKWIYSTLSEDATLLGYTGGDADDPRVYFQHIPVEVFNKFTGTTGCVVSFYLMSSGGFEFGPIWALQKPDESYAVDIYARSKSVLENAFERIDALLNEETQPSITDWQVKRIRRLMQADLYEPEDHIHHKHLEYKFIGILDAS